MRHTNKQELTERFVAAAEDLNRQMHIERLPEWEEMNMNFPQLKTLVLLERFGPLRMGTISMYLGRALSATTTIVDRLVEKKLVDRSTCPEDRRVVLCELTEQGREEINRFWHVGIERVQPVVDMLDIGQLEAIVQSLELIRWAGQEIRRTSESLHLRE